ncbi:hypothetical protein CCACVL1_27180 [Corchorus capsularis]|uniref:Legume lectin domain-containing protein n=1 Tax=Corchorus capsularis TaxID=210143 RepID=A0A1R3GBW9_COCAP|nr:hypothetical protein CCACVL1_27180 [Corchorus capsularis]
MAMAEMQKLTVKPYQFGPFDSSYYDTFAVIKPATISNEALQITPDSIGNFSLTNRSGRIFFNQTFKLWNDDGQDSKGTTKIPQVASFNSSFLINVFRVNNSVPGEDGT